MNPETRHLLFRRLSRRGVLRGSALGVVGLGLAGCASNPAPAPAPQ